jgi:hypothetical protein
MMRGVPQNQVQQFVSWPPAGIVTQANIDDLIKIASFPC